MEADTGRKQLARSFQTDFDSINAAFYLRKHRESDEVACNMHSADVRCRLRPEYDHPRQSVQQTLKVTGTVALVLSQSPPSHLVFFWPCPYRWLI